MSTTLVQGRSDSQAPSSTVDMVGGVTTTGQRALTWGCRAFKHVLNESGNFLIGATICAVFTSIHGAAVRYMAVPEIQEFIQKSVTPFFLYNSMFHPEIFEPKESEIPMRAGYYYQLAEAQKTGIESLGVEISKEYDPVKILSSSCPKDEFFKQSSVFDGMTIDGSTTLSAPSWEHQLTANFKNLVFFMPLAEEVLFRGVLQDLLLKRLPEKIIKRISPENAGKVESKIYTAVRILLTSAAFSYYHEMNRGTLSDEYVTLQRVASFLMGIGFGLLKEQYGLSASIGAHMMQNVGPALADHVSKC